MQWIELQDVEYGECIVLGGRNRSILMVDCGSMNQKLREGETPVDARFVSIAQRYSPCMERYFLLTHFHRDHLCGLRHILKENPGYFNRILLPCTPLDGRGVPLLLELALFAAVFSPPQSDSYQVNTSCIRMFHTLGEDLDAQRIFTLQAGDIFRFDQVDYQVLWPQVQDFPFDSEIISAAEQLEILISSPLAPKSQRRFVECKEEFLSLYTACCTAFSVSGRAEPAMRQVLLDKLDAVLEEMEELREDLALSPSAHKIREILENPLFSSAYSDCTNAASVVFHNIRTREAGFEDILMTGDITPEILSGLSNQLYDGYNILKAPHHGTASGYCSLFSEMSAAHILISNGEYHAGGAIAQEYIDMETSVRHCTNRHACKWYQASQACCNRLAYCYDQDGAAGLVIKCATAKRPILPGMRAPGCGITTVGPSAVRACICE